MSDGIQLQEVPEVPQESREVIAAQEDLNQKSWCSKCGESKNLKKFKQNWSRLLKL